MAGSAMSSRRRRYRWRPARSLAFLTTVLILMLATGMGVEAWPSRASARGDGGDAVPAVPPAGPGVTWHGRAGESRSALRPDGSVVVVVRPGDTLWEVAQRYGRTDRDPRDVVAAIMEASGLSTAQLRPGMVLVVPAALARR
ncbi:Peptidoglycan-binding lysin domain [Thermaerobacter marianensis DSM 12885]|uniref:Peptidoglycan-binding lysin domain n=1 Tax=Thermaerobacter marianensis (strain ATCC 700841 / DSM 12885 / JCM 10246 / 7p75a) TaxID=644966 RepID=E6SK56_THEM7|nr:Peptidoglycan-binding lysin domain [Thermaerobacter marianensis DSM 12885]